MMIYTTRGDYSLACNIAYESTAGRRLQGLPYLRDTRRLYHLADVLPTTKPRERADGAIERLFDTASVSRHQWYCGRSVTPTARAFEQWISPDEAWRLYECRTRFIGGLAEALQSAEPFRFLPRLLLCLPQQSQVLRYVMLGKPVPFEWKTMAPEFALVNAQYEDVLSIEEAA